MDTEELNAEVMPDPPFTPGPWFHSHRKCDDGMHRTQVYDAVGKEIATLAWYPFPHTGRLGRVVGTSRAANAALMAAAPDLLEALEAAQWSERWLDERDNRTMRRCPICACAPYQGHRDDCVIGAAIRKARGLNPDAPRISRSRDGGMPVASGEGVQAERDIRCRECNAPKGEPCVALLNGRYRRKGEPINGYHVSRSIHASGSSFDPLAIDPDDEP